MLSFSFSKIWLATKVGCVCDHRAYTLKNRTIGEICQGSVSWLLKACFVYCGIVSGGVSTRKSRTTVLETCVAVKGKSMKWLDFNLSVCFFFCLRIWWLWFEIFYWEIRTALGGDEGVLRLVLILYTFDEERDDVAFEHYRAAMGGNHCRSEFGSFRELFLGRNGVTRNEA